MHRSTEIVALLLLAFVWLLSGNAYAQQKFLLGAFPGAGMNVDTFEAKIKHTIGIVGHAMPFLYPLHPVIQKDIDAGRVPMLAWTSDNGLGGSVLATDILAGKYDTQINSLAASVAALEGTVFVEWEPEMTDNRLMEQFFTNVPADQWGATYVSVWQYIHGIFVANSATNAQWVWTPGGNAYQVDWRGIIPCQAYFPGTAYVDWMGLDSFNKDNKPEAYDANPQLLAFYAVAPIWAPGKPLIHAQTGATRKTDAQEEWIATATTSLPTEFPLIRGFVYFNRDGNHPSKGKSMKYRLKGAGLLAFQIMAADPYFQ